MTPRVSAVVLSYQDEPWLERCIHALLASEGVEIDVVLVDNGCTDGAVERLRGTPSLTVVGDGENLGFSPGCNFGATFTKGDYLVMANGDLVVEPDALARLVEVASDPTVGIAGGSIRLNDDIATLNSAGNDIHFLGFSWVGGFGEPAATHAIDQDVAGAMAALVMLRRDVWESLDGYEPHYFAFHEDADMSWRCWQRGLRVHYVPDAIGRHRYEFGRVGNKMYLVERNRLIFMLTCWDSRTLVLLAPLIAATEVAMALIGAKSGWFGEKVHGWGWLFSHRKWLRDRRRVVQSERTVGDKELSALMSDRLDAKNFPIPESRSFLDAAAAGYWHLARRFLR
jgi:GT2 family glycosyltransferase